MLDYDECPSLEGLRAAWLRSQGLHDDPEMIEIFAGFDNELFLLAESLYGCR